MERACIVDRRHSSVRPSLCNGTFPFVTNAANLGSEDGRCDKVLSTYSHNTKSHSMFLSPSSSSRPSVTSSLLLLSLCCVQSGKFGNTTPSEAHESQPQGIQYAEDAAEHENMKAVLKSSLHGGDSGASTVPGHRTRTRASSSRGPSL